MADGKKSFIAYSDWKDTFDELPDEKAGQLIKHIFAYVSDENPQTDDFIIKAVFANIKNTLKRDLKKWEKQQSQRVEAGKRSAEIRKQKATSVERALNSVHETERNSTVSVNVSDNVSVNVSDNVDNKLSINIPSFEDFKKHAESKEPKIDLRALKLKYDAWVENGWKDGNDKKIKNWKSKLTNTIQYISIDNNKIISEYNNLTLFKCSWSNTCRREYRCDNEAEAREIYYNETGTYPDNVEVA